MTERRVRSRHARRRSYPLVRYLAAAVALLLVGGAGGYALGLVGDRPAPDPVATTGSSEDTGAPAAASHPTMLGQVTRVVSGDEVLVRVGETEQTVRILGLDAPALGTSPGAPSPQCGSREALAYADRRLTGQTVTLVPDPTVPERDERGARLAYVVLRSQQNFTDAALLDGVGRADTSRQLWYADVFARGQATAVDARRGMWGAPCNTRP